MGALVRTELLMELLTRLTTELVVDLGWQGTAFVVLGVLVRRGLRDRAGDEAPATGRHLEFACVATVLLALLLLGGAG